MRSISHWTPRYIIDRLAVELFRRKYSEELPSLGVGAIQFLDGYLSKNDTMFEFGAGYSTAWFAGRVGTIVSVESDEGWYRLVKEKISAFDNARICLVNSESNLTHLSNVSWDYVNKIREYEKESFDFILNDGYARPLVANVALEYLKKGGVLAWDDFGGSFPVDESCVPGRIKAGANVDRETTEFLDAVKTWRRVIFDDGTHTTAVFFRPN